MVEDEEDLYRRVGKDGLIDGRVSSSAFNDPGFQPSVDRARFRERPEDSQLSPTDGIVLLVVGEVRGITNIKIVAEEDATHQIDVIYCPVEADNPKGLPENPAHSQVQATPGFMNPSRFRRLKEALALLASKRPPVIEPA